MTKRFLINLALVLVFLSEGLILASGAFILTQDMTLVTQGYQMPSRVVFLDKTPRVALVSLAQAAIWPINNSWKSVKNFLINFYHAAGEIINFIYSLMIKLYKAFYWPENLE